LVAERNTPVRLAFSTDGLVVEAGSSEEARASEALDATFDAPAGGEEPWVLAFNPAYLLDGLNALNAPTAVFSFVEAGKPAVISPGGEDGTVVPGYRYLIMPIRVVR
jgi:DNA polymerase-3 subunit beta